jgi:hypothetical protein
MKINLHYNNDDWLQNDGEIKLCHGILSRFGLKTDKEYTLSVRTRNPRRKGFTKVNLTKQSKNHCWNWEIPSMNLTKPHDKFCPSYHFFSFNESILNNMFPKPLAVSVWIKFEETN